MLTVLFGKKTWHHSYSTYRRREKTMRSKEVVIVTTTTRPLSAMTGSDRLKIRGQRIVTGENYGV